MYAMLNDVIQVTRDDYRETLNELANTKAENHKLRHALFLLAGDVEAFHRSCSCEPPVTDKERENLAMAKELVGDYEPPPKRTPCA